MHHDKETWGHIDLQPGQGWLLHYSTRAHTHLVHGVVDLLEFLIAVSGLSQGLDHYVLNLRKQLFQAQSGLYHFDPWDWSAFISIKVIFPVKQMIKNKLNLFIHPNVPDVKDSYSTDCICRALWIRICSMTTFYDTKVTAKRSSKCTVSLLTQTTAFL